MSMSQRNVGKTPLTRQSGMTMLEALIAGVILAIGILGIVSLLLISKTSQHAAIQHTRAVALADDLLERIRRNPSGMGTYNIGTAAPLGGDSIANEPAPDCVNAACSATQLAAHDQWAWEEMLDDAFGVEDENGSISSSMRGCVLFNADTGKTNTGAVAVILQWQGLQETADAVAGGTVCGGAANIDKLRRQVVLRSYVVDEAEL
ncbi:MAG: type IV pilus modification protein PilV [Halioglobus sp.]|nr:type IV pilus modification protein PilV [Halioglobus sp.]